MNIVLVIFHIIIFGSNYINYINYKISINYINHMNKKITRSGAMRNNTTSSGLSMDEIQQNVLYSQIDIETIKKNITTIQSINEVYNNRIVVLEDENMKLKQIIKQLINIDY